MGSTNNDFDLHYTLNCKRFLRPKGRGFSTNETECPNGVNDGSDKNVWKLAYKQAYC